MTDETRNLIEEEIRKEVCELKNIDPCENQELYCKVVGNIARLAERLTEDDKVSAQWCDAQERREVERERNRLTYQAEAEKNKLDWKRFGLEAAKIIVPAGLTIYNIFNWNKVMGIVMNYETNGFLTSTASRMLGLNSMAPKVKI